MNNKKISLKGVNCHGLAPISKADANILILGSMPSKTSLITSQYYAHPRNLFWPIISEILTFEPDITYEQKCQRLCEKKIALWDVIRSCQRDSSADADIIQNSISINDFETFFSNHLVLKAIFFNGQMAEKTFDNGLTKKQKNKLINLCLSRLPSTSPANARMSYQKKMQIWRTELNAISI